MLDLIIRDNFNFSRNGLVGAKSICRYVSSRLVLMLDHYSDLELDSEANSERFSIMANVSWFNESCNHECECQQVLK